MFRILVATILFAAAVLKGRFLFSGGAPSDAWLNVLSFGLVALEFCLGLGLLAKFWIAGAWRLTAWLFAFFSVASLGKWIQGAPTCGCFGEFPVPPAAAFMLDVAILAGLIYFAPPTNRPSAFGRYLRSNAPAWVAGLMFGAQPEPSSPGAALAAAPSRSARANFLAFGATGLLVAAIAWWPWNTNRNQVKTISGLSISQASLNFGEAWIQDEFPWKLTLQNRTADPIEVLDLKTPCTCVTFDRREFVVPPGQSLDVFAKIDLRSSGGLFDFKGCRSCAAKDTVNKVTFARQVSVEPKINAASKSWRFRAEIVPVVRGAAPGMPGCLLIGTVMRSVGVVPDRIDFPEPLVCGKPVPTQHVTLTTFGAVAKVVVSCPTEKGIVSISATDERTFVASVSPRADLTPGDYWFPVTITPVATNGARLPKFSIPVSVRILNDIFLEPSSVHFGQVPARYELEETVGIVSRSGVPLTVVKVEADDGICISQAAPNVPKYDIRLTAERGVHEKKIRFHVRRDGDSDVIFVLPVQFEGM